MSSEFLPDFSADSTRSTSISSATMSRFEQGDLVAEAHRISAPFGKRLRSWRCA